jgi:hypothetical protein
VVARVVVLLPECLDAVFDLFFVLYGIGESEEAAPVVFEQAFRRSGNAPVRVSDGICRRSHVSAYEISVFHFILQRKRKFCKFGFRKTESSLR